jgi:hypothetical protein
MNVKSVFLNANDAKNTNLRKNLLIGRKARVICRTERRRRDIVILLYVLFCYKNGTLSELKPKGLILL